MRKLKGIKVVFFDFDGTLVDTTEREVQTIYLVACHFGLHSSKEELMSLLEDVSTGWRETRSYSDAFRALGLELTDQLIEYWISTFLQEYRLSKTRPGTKDTLRTLSATYMLLCVTSRETLAEVERELKYLGLKRFFKRIVTREVAADFLGLDSLPFAPFREQRKKLYEGAMGIAGCQPNEVLVVGDMASELNPAKAMGMRTIGLLSGKGRETELGRASDILIENISELIVILQNRGVKQ